MNTCPLIDNRIRTYRYGYFSHSFSAKQNQTYIHRLRDPLKEWMENIFFV